MKTLPNKFWIKIYSKEHGQIVIDRLKSLNVKYEKSILQRSIETYGINRLAFSVDGELNYSPPEFYSLHPEYGPQISTDDLFSLEFEKKINVVLNNNYSAIVDKDGIKVGCQTFPLDIIEKLVDAKKLLS